MNLRGRKVQNINTGQIKVITRCEYTGLATFTDGSTADIHHMNNPEKQDGKNWRYVEEPIVEQLKTENYAIY
mgnify:CR=1 FL=1